MRQFEITRQLFDRELTARIVRLDEGIHVLVYGGSRPHIGAVSVIAPGGDCTTIQFPHHRDGVVSEMWAKALAEVCKESVAVAAGIHYDDLSKEDIQKILSVMEEMVAEASVLLSSDSKRDPDQMV